MSQNNERYILQKLIAFLGVNSTLSEAISSPKTDKHTCVLGRGEDVLDCIAQITGASYAEIKAIADDSGLPSEQTLISKLYLGSLISTTVNLKLKDAVENETGIKAMFDYNFNLRFIALDGEDDYEAKTTVGLTYSVVRQSNGYKARVYLPHNSEIIGREIPRLKEAQEICTKDFNERLMKMLYDV